MSFVYRALQALFIVYENTFEIKNGKGHYKLSFETKNIKIGSVWGALWAKTAQKLAGIELKFVYCALQALFIVYEKILKPKLVWDITSFHVIP